MLHCCAKLDFVESPFLVFIVNICDELIVSFISVAFADQDSCNGFLQLLRANLLLLCLSICWNRRKEVVIGFFNLSSGKVWLAKKIVDESEKVTLDHVVSIFILTLLWRFKFLIFKSSWAIRSIFYAIEEKLIRNPVIS